MQNTQDAGHQGDTAERRRHIRIPAVQSRILIGEFLREFPVRDLSLSGLGIERLGWTFSEGEQLELELLEGDVVVLQRVRARVRRLEGRYAGLEYVGLSDDQRARLTAFLLAKIKRREPIEVAREPEATPEAGGPEATSAPEVVKKRAMRVVLDDLRVYVPETREEFEVRDLSVEGMAFFHNDSPIIEQSFLKLEIRYRGETVVRELAARFTRVTRKVLGCVFEGLAEAQQEQLYALISTRIDLDLKELREKGGELPELEQTQPPEEADGERRGEDRIPAINMRIYLEDSVREFPVKDISESGLGFIRLGWPFVPGEQLTLDLIDGGDVLLRGLPVRAVRASHKTVGCVFEELTPAMRDVLRAVARKKLYEHKPLGYHNEAAEGQAAPQNVEDAAQAEAAGRPLRILMQELRAYLPDYEREFVVRDLSVEGMAFLHQGAPVRQHAYLTVDLVYDGRTVVSDLPLRIVRVDETSMGGTFETLDLDQIEALYTLISTRVQL